MILRLAAPPDALAVARVHVRAWQVAYRGLLPDDFLDAVRPEERAARYTFGVVGKPVTTIALAGGDVLGFATTHGDELAALYVDPDRWSTGVGRALIADARARLAVAGVTTAQLWMLAGNARADRFYRADGWSPGGSRRGEHVWGITEDVRYTRVL